LDLFLSTAIQFDHPYQMAAIANHILLYGARYPRMVYVAALKFPGAIYFKPFGGFWRVTRDRGY
jgi:hypothetical protein